MGLIECVEIEKFRVSDYRKSTGKHEDMMLKNFSKTKNKNCELERKGFA